MFTQRADGMRLPGLALMLKGLERRSFYDHDIVFYMIDLPPGNNKSIC